MDMTASSLDYSSQTLMYSNPQNEIVLCILCAHLCEGLVKMAHLKTQEEHVNVWEGKVIIIIIIFWGKGYYELF